MYYSIFTVGDVDIDQEHTNIDFMLTSLDDLSFDQLPATLEKLVDAIIQHFTNEESICIKRGYNMAEDHIAMHRQVTEELLTMKRSLHVTGADLQSYPAILQNMLKTHILEYDRFMVALDPLAS